MLSYKKELAKKRGIKNYLTGRVVILNTIQQKVLDLQNMYREATTLLFGLILTNCAYTPISPVECPYDPEEVVKAAVYIKQVSIWSFHDLSRPPRAPCSTFDDGSLGFIEDLSIAGTKECLYHETCHLYEIFVLKRPYEDIRLHQGWTRKGIY